MIQSSYIPESYAGNDVTDTFAYNWQIQDETEIVAKSSDDDTLEIATLVLNTDYTVTGVGNDEGGNVVLVTPLATGKTLTIERSTPVTQETEFGNQGGFFPEDHGDAFDKVVRILQEKASAISRALKASVLSGLTDLELPEPESLKVLRWNAAADAIENAEISATELDYPGAISFGAYADRPASPSEGDIYVSTDYQLVSVCYTAGTWTNVGHSHGTAASIPATPKAGMVYLETDTGKLQRCFVNGTWTTKMVFDKAVDFAQASNLASASSLDLGAVAGNYVNITGTTGITSFGTAQAGVQRLVRFTGALTLTYNASSMILPGAADISTSANDVALFVSEGSGNWRCAFYQPASGLASLPEGFIYGMIPANNGTDATNDLDFTAGKCRSDDDTFDIEVPALTKKIDAVFAEGTNQGCLDTGTIGASADIIYFYAIGGSGKTGDIVGTKTQGSPSMPSGYTAKRYIFGLRWTGTAWELFTATGNGGNLWIHFFTQRVLTTTSTASTYTDLDCSAYVPLGARLAHITGMIDSGSGQVHARLYWRPNGSSDSASQGFAGGTTANGYTFVGWTLVSLDANAIFEYTDSGSVDSMSISIRGYQEVR